MGNAVFPHQTTVDTPQKKVQDPIILVCIASKMSRSLHQQNEAWYHHGETQHPGPPRQRYSQHRLTMGQTAVDMHEAVEVQATSSSHHRTDQASERFCIVPHEKLCPVLRALSLIAAVKKVTSTLYNTPYGVIYPKYKDICGIVADMSP